MESQRITAKRSRPSGDRGHRAFRLGLLAAGVAACLVAPAAWAAKVVEVRVGSHPTFTRVVFELDDAAGYRIVRESAPSGESVVVTLDAGSEAHRIRSRSKGITSVEVEESSDGATAHIQLRQSGLRIQEMILARPPRIVLDVMLPEEQPATAASPAAAKTAGRARRSESPSPTTAAPRRSVVPKAPTPYPEPAAEPAAPSPERRSARMVTPAPAAVPSPSDSASQTASQTREPVSPRPEVPGTSVVPKMPGARGTTPAAVPEPPAAAKPATPSRKEPNLEEPTREVATAQPAAPSGVSGWLGDPILLGAGAAILLGLAAIGFVFVRRRRAIPNDLNFDALAETTDAGEAAAPASAAQTRIPAGGFSMDGFSTEDASQDAVEAAPDDMAATPGAEAEDRQTLGDLFGESDDLAGTEPVGSDRDAATEEYGSIPLAAQDDAPSSVGDLFDEDTDLAQHNKGDDSMSQNLTDLPADRADMPPASPPAPPAAAPAIDPDVMRLVQELSQRVTQLETRLEESLEARERLERQVAAQSEELRVQRAAIARTQRALRSMSRSDEEKATEPALREGGENTQMRTRVNV